MAMDAKHANMNTTGNSHTLTGSAALRPAAPALPLNVVELILATVPSLCPTVTPLVTLVNVISPQLVPTALASFIVGSHASGSKTYELMRKVLKRLFGNPATDKTQFCNLLLGCLRPALDRNRLKCTTGIISLIVESGNLDLLMRVGSLKMQSQGYQHRLRQEVAISRAVAEGHVNILEWWAATGEASGLSFEAFGRHHVIDAARLGHLSVLQWWSRLDPPRPFNFAGSTLVNGLVANGRVAILQWWKRRFGQESIEFRQPHWILASENGHCDVLDLVKAQRLPFPDSMVDCIDKAAGNGHIRVLQWWYHVKPPAESRLIFDYTVRAFDNACANGHVQVLDFFARSGLELRFTPAAMQLARENGHAQIVEWLHRCPLYNTMVLGSLASLPLGVQQRGPPTDFIMLCAFGVHDAFSKTVRAQSESTIAHAIHVASRLGQLNILRSIHAVKYEFAAFPSVMTLHGLTSAIENNQPAVVRWWVKHMTTSSCLLPISQSWHLHRQAVTVALNNGYVEVLEILRAVDLFATPFPAFLTKAACSPRAMCRSLEFLSTVAPVDSWSAADCDGAWREAAILGNVSALQWLLDKRVPWTQADSHEWIDGASGNGHFLVLEWWVSSLLPLPFTELALWDALRNKHRKVIGWWIRSGRVAGNYMLEMLQEAFDELGRVE